MADKLFTDVRSRVKALVMKKNQHDGDSLPKAPLEVESADYEVLYSETDAEGGYTRLTTSADSCPDKTI